jgi:hypothetical protein
MKRLAFLLYAWGSTILMGVLIYWLATVPNFEAGEVVEDELVKVVFRMTLYSIFFILFYRSIIITLKSTVERLSSFRSKGEKSEDAEFVLIIETFVVLVSILATTIFAIFEEYTQNFVEGRNAEVKDILISIMSILLTAIVVYSIPVIGELELAIKHKLDEGYHGIIKKKKKQK